jgi:undecaprenyl pyrophosphate phosphatase UppP
VRGALCSGTTDSSPISGLVRPSLAARRLVTTDADERLAWLLIIGTIPVGITGLLLEHTFRTLFAKRIPAAIFLTANGPILLTREYLRRKAPVDEAQNDLQAGPAPVGGVPFVAYQPRATSGRPW